MQVNERRMRVADRRELTGAVVITGFPPRERKRAGAQPKCVGDLLAPAEAVRRPGSAAPDRSEERRAGTDFCRPCRSTLSPSHYKKKNLNRPPRIQLTNTH